MNPKLWVPVITAADKPYDDWHHDRSCRTPGYRPQSAAGCPVPKSPLVFLGDPGCFLGVLRRSHGRLVHVSLFPFFEPFSVLVTCPLYALHILVLAAIVLRHPRPLFACLFFAGALTPRSGPSGSDGLVSSKLQSRTPNFERAVLRTSPALNRAGVLTAAILSVQMTLTLFIDIGAAGGVCRDSR
jgi:hypothetical protein